MGFLLQSLFLLWSISCRHAGLVAPCHMGSSQTRGWTPVPCTDWWILNPWVNPRGTWAQTLSSSHLLPSICLFPVPSLRESSSSCYCCPLTCFACLSTCQEELLLSHPGPVCLLYPTALYILLVSSVFRPCFADTSTREGVRTPGIISPCPSASPFSLMLTS